MDNTLTLAHIRQKIKDDKSLKKRTKRRLLRKLQRTPVQLAVLDEVTSQAYASNVITLTNDESNAQIDFDALIDFIERLIPLIVKLIDLFA